MGFVIKKATKANTRLRLAFIGLSGGGKTWKALALGTSLGRRVVVIDSERGSASKYANDFSYDVLELDTFAPATYCEAINACVAGGYDVIIIDSLSHAWMGKDGALETVDKIAKRQGGGSFNAWRDVTPMHNALVDTILRTPAHVIVTLRAKTEFSQEKDERTGKTVVRKIGLAAVQRDGLEYEFDVVADVDQDHNAIITKTRCSALTDAVIPPQSEALARTLREWLSDGAPAATAPSPAPQVQPSATEPAQQPAAVATAQNPAPADNPKESVGSFAPPPDHTELLNSVYEQITHLELPGAAVRLWIAARPDLARCTVTEREAVWKALCAQTEKVGKMKNAKVWLKKAIAEEDARAGMATNNGSPSTPPDDGGGGGGGAPAPSTGGDSGAETSSTRSAPAAPTNAQAMLAQFREHLHGKPRRANDHTKELSEIAGSYLKRRALFENAGIWRRALDITRAELRTRGCEEPDALLTGVSQQVYGRAM